jgi:hypothetical protein
MVNNIKRDPFEIAGGLDDQKSFMALGGALASPSTPRSDQPVASAALRQVLPRRAGRDWLVADAHGPLSTLTALSVVPEHKLRLCHDRDELTIRRCDARLPHHRSPPAMQRHRFADNPTADGCGAYEVGFAFDRGGTAPIRQVCERSKRA